MSFVTKELDLILFLNGRMRIKHNCHEAVRSYIHRRKKLYSRYCNQKQENATYRKCRHLIGVDKGRVWCQGFHRALKLKRDLVKDAPWKLSPNRYDVPLEIYEKHKGAGGAHWAKIHSQKSAGDKSTEKRTRYNIKFFYAQIAWLFTKNARKRRATERVMVSNLSGCYRNPKHPGPQTYCPKNHRFEEFISKPIKTSPPNPHLFLRGSSVPEKTLSLVPRHISMDPAPGRYDIFYSHSCPCSAKLIPMPGLALFIDRQKRNRFRGLPFQHIPVKKYCDPHWRHVPGHGFSFLFKIPRPKAGEKAPEKPKPPKSAKQTETVKLKMFHDLRYKAMIIEPVRLPISNPSLEVPEKPPKIKFNSLSKRVIRKQLRSNKKIAFQSGQERWKDGYRLPLLTYAQQQANKELLPLERQLREHEVTRRSISEIKSKLREVPPHMLPVYKPVLRKRLFKFQPLPGTKVLVKEQDMRPDMVDGKYECKNYYVRTVDPERFFYGSAESKRFEEMRQKYANKPQQEEIEMIENNEEKDKQVQVEGDQVRLRRKT